MAKTIYKWVLPVTDVQKVHLPVGAEILTVQNQHGYACLWALVDPDEKKTEIRIIEIFGTGHLIRKEGYRKYISTYQLEGGDLVFHVFEYTGD